MIAEQIATFICLFIEGFICFLIGYGLEEGDKRKMTKQQEFRKQAEEAKFEAFSLMCRKVADLEKENAELKKKKEEIEIMTNFCKACKKMHTDNLTKAKEIIREYSKQECEYCDYKRNPDYVTMHCSQCQKYSLHKEAEQFLKECK